jgi:hypothetical protein
MRRFNEVLLTGELQGSLRIPHDPTEIGIVVLGWSGVCSLSSVPNFLQPMVRWLLQFDILVGTASIRLCCKLFIKTTAL